MRLYVGSLFVLCSLSLFGMSKKAACEPAACTPEAPAMICEKPYLQGEPLNCQFNSAYSAPAEIDVNHKFCNCPLGFIAEASFLYWYGEQEGLNVASNGVLSTGSIFFAEQIQTISQTFDYHPGFQLGLGVVLENEWTLHSEYTWLRGENSFSRSAPSTTTPVNVDASAVPSGAPVWTADDWFLQGTVTGQALAGTEGSSKCRYGGDVVELLA